MELNALLERLKMPHLADRLDTVCEQAAKRELGYCQTFPGTWISLPSSSEAVCRSRARLL